MATRRRQRSSRRSTRKTKSTPRKAAGISAVGVVKAFVEGRFRNVSRTLEQKAHRQITSLRKRADQKSIELHRKVGAVQKEVTATVRQQAKRDLRMLEGKIRTLTSRLKQLERRIQAR